MDNGGKVIYLGECSSACTAKKPAAKAKTTKKAAPKK